MHKSFWSAGIFFFFVLGGIFAFHPKAFAFSLSPLRHTIIVDPGKTAVAQVEIFNNESTPIQVVAEIDAFSIDPDTGHAKFGENSIAKSWIQSNGVVISLAPQEKRVVDFTVTVPPESAPESHYLALFLKQNSTEGQIAIGKRIGTLLFLHVSGDVQEKMQVQDFSVTKNQGKQIFYIQTVNQGTIHLIPLGTIQIFNMWGKKITEVPINTTDRKVLPDAVWRANLEVPHMGLGRMRAELIVNYGATKQQITQSVFFWNIPWIFVGALGFAATLLGGFLVWKKLKKV